MVTSSNPTDFSGIPPKTSTTTSPPRKPAPPPPARITIDLATLSDAPAIAELGARCFSDTFGYSVPASDLADFLASTYTPAAISADILDSANQATFVARDASFPSTSSSAVVGFVQLLRGATERGVPGDAGAHAELRRLYVDPGAHGRGIGGALISAVEARARDEGWQQLWLSVWEDNPKAQRIYERRGYVRVGELEFATGGCLQTDWVLSKAL